MLFFEDKFFSVVCCFFFSYVWFCLLSLFVFSVVLFFPDVVHSFGVLDRCFLIGVFMCVCVSGVF